MSQSKNFRPDELKHHRDQLYLAIRAAGGAVPPLHTKDSNTRRGVVTLELYDRRYPLYLAAVEFIRAMLAVNDIELQTIFKFFAATTDASFLFDDSISSYFLELAKKGTELRADGLMIDHPNYVDKRQRLIDEQATLINWFSNQHDELRRKMIPFMRVQ